METPFESNTLNMIYRYELEHGNHVKRVDENKWQSCGLSIVMYYPLKILKSEERKKIDDSVVFWECRDTHYEVQSGFDCKSTREGIAGPLTVYDINDY